jgi:RNA polymerase sigma factor (sigma-70 family)
VTDSADRLPEPGRAVLADLYRRYGPWLIARVRGRFGIENAEDVVQETWLRLAPIGAREEIRHPKALLLRIASNLAINQGRQAVRQAKILETEGAGHGLATQAEDQTQAVLLRQIILGLPEPLHDVFVLSRFKGLTHAQIADQLGVPVTTVEWRMSKAVAHVTAQLRL